MTSISRSFKRFFEVELRRNFTANSITDNEAGVGDVTNHNLVFPRHSNTDERERESGGIKFKHSFVKLERETVIERERERESFKSERINGDVGFWGGFRKFQSGGQNFRSKKY